MITIDNTEPPASDQTTGIASDSVDLTLSSMDGRGTFLRMHESLPRALYRKSSGPGGSLSKARSLLDQLVCTLPYSRHPRQLQREALASRRQPNVCSVHPGGGIEAGPGPADCTPAVCLRPSTSHANTVEPLPGIRTSIPRPANN